MRHLPAGLTDWCRVSCVRSMPMLFSSPVRSRMQGWRDQPCFDVKHESSKSLIMLLLMHSNKNIKIKHISEGGWLGRRHGMCDYLRYLVLLSQFSNTLGHIWRVFITFHFSCNYTRASMISIYAFDIYHRIFLYENGVRSTYAYRGAQKEFIYIMV